MNKIDVKFKELKEINKKAIIPFIAMGNKNLSESIEIVKVLESAGSDMVEIGLPYSDPLADGPEIQNAYNEALLSGIKVNQIIEVVKRISLNSNIPIIMKVYYNMIFSKGIEIFIRNLSEAGVSGLIVPDIPLEEMEELSRACYEKDIYLIPIVASRSKERIKKITKEYNKGFVYCLLNDIDKKQVSENAREYLQEVRNCTDMPICIDFKLLSVEEEIKEYYNAIVIEDKLVKIMSSEETFIKRKEQVFKFIKKIKEKI